MPANAYRFDLRTMGWWPLNYAVLPTNIYLQEGPGLATLLMGASDGEVYYMGVTQADDGTAINGQVTTPSIDFEDTRSTKLLLDYMMDANPDGTTLTCTPQVNNRATNLTAATITGSSRAQTPVAQADTNLTLYRNVALQLTWSADDATPELFEYQPNALLQPFYAKNFSTQFLSHGATGFGHLSEGWIVYLSNSTITLAITPTDGTPGTTSTLNLPSTGGEISKYYLRLPVIKGQMFRYNLYSSTEFIVFSDETLFSYKPWGSDGPYNSVRPFVSQTAPNLTGA